MKRIRLSKDEKTALRLLASVGWCPDTYPFHRFAGGVEGLQSKGFALAAWASGHELVSADLTTKGETYLALNPSLRNPVDWVKVGAIAALITASIAAIGFLVGCNFVINS